MAGRDNDSGGDGCVDKIDFLDSIFELGITWAEPLEALDDLDDDELDDDDDIDLDDLDPTAGETKDFLVDLFPRMFEIKKEVVEQFWNEGAESEDDEESRWKHFKEGGEEGSSLQKRRTSVPKAWLTYLEGKTKSKDAPQSAIRTRQLMYELYTSKIQADKVDRSMGQDVAELDRFVIDYFHDQFGEKDLVQRKLRQMLKGVRKYMADDPYVLTFARFLGIDIEPKEGENWSSQGILQDDNTAFNSTFLNTYLWGLDVLVEADKKHSELLNVLDDQERKKLTKEVQKTETLDPKTVMSTIM